MNDIQVFVIFIILFITIIVQMIQYARLLDRYFDLLKEKKNANISNNETLYR